jgi:hypothetical protein
MVYSGRQSRDLLLSSKVALKLGDCASYTEIGYSVVLMDVELS